MKLASPSVTLIMMKQTFVTTLMIFSAFISKGQIGKIFINGQQFESNGVSFFEFKPLEIVLTQPTIKYLTDFGNQYKNHFPNKSTFSIALSTETSSEVNKDKVDPALTSQRLEAVLRYLEIQFAVSKTQFKILVQTTISTICESYIDKNKPK